MRPLLPASLATAFLVCLSACSGGGDSGDTETQGGSSQTAGTAGKGGSPAKGGSSSNNGGTSSEDGGASPASGGKGEGGEGEQPMGGSGGSSELPTGLTGNGITGTFNGVVHLHTFNPTNIPQQSKTVIITATSAQYPLYDAWSIRFMPELGAQACTGDTGTEDTFITFGSQSNYELAGTTASGGSCTLNVTSIAPFTGTFTAKLMMASGLVDVTDGAFSVPN